MPNFFQKVEQGLGDLEKLLRDAVGTDLTQPAIQTSLLNDLVHVLQNDLGVPSILPNGMPLTAAVMSDILSVLLNGVLVADKKEPVETLIPKVMATITDFLGKI